MNGAELKQGLASKIILLCWTALLGAGLLLGWVFWSLWWPFNPLTVNPGSWTIANPGKTVQRGGTLLVRMNYCKNTNDTARMVSSIEQGPSLWLLSSEHPAFTLGCHEQTVGLVTVPVALPLEATTGGGHGKAILRVRLHYRINPLREVTYAFATDEFTIAP